MKKFLCSLLVIICMFGLTACNGEKKMLSYDEATITQQAFFVNRIVSAEYPDEVINQYHEFNDYQLEEQLSDPYYTYLGIRIDGETTLSAIDSYRGSIGEIGEVVESGKNITISPSEEELIVNYDITGTLHNGSIEIIYDKNLNITSVTTNVEYSFAECMQKAGVNTAIGMGTVFVMLIVIMIIIIILGAATSGVRNQDKKDSAAAASVDKAIETIVAHEEQADDLELVAVIAAAIAASEGATSTDGFVVRSIKRIR